jgi:hypothetical protein
MGNLLSTPAGRNLGRTLLTALLLLVILAGCGAPQTQPAEISVSVSADGASQQVTLPSGSTVQEALGTAGINLSPTDRVNPPLFTALSGGEIVAVTRVREEFETQQVILPFERLELRNESMPAGETRLVQAGQNGLSEVTIRHVFEDGVETGSSTVSETVLQAAVDEIVMIGVQSPFSPVPIPGKLAYLTGGNAWIMETSTALRRPLVTTGDLDGRVFSLSPDGKWLLFTRKSPRPADQEINTLWAVSTAAQPSAPASLGISNVVHFADWQPGEKYLIAYSTVEPRATAPGWQANNDLHFIGFADGQVGRTYDILTENSGGIYGWWGTSFAWSPDGQQLAYSRPDGAGLVDINDGTLTPLVTVTPFNTHSDWAWTPGLAWGSDNRTLYLVTHAPPTGLEVPEESPNFDMTSLSLTAVSTSPFARQSGMFAYPAGSSLRQNESGSTYLVAYLQAVFPAQSATSRYRLVVAEPNGADARTLFPPEGQSGLSLPQTPVWAPHRLDSGGDFIAIIYEGNLWIVDAASGQAQQVTGDGLTGRIDWK